MDNPFWEFFQMSEQQREEMQRQADTHSMAMNDFHHAFQRLFEEASLEHLNTYKQMLNFIVHSNGSVLAAQWLGMVQHALKSRFNICITCGVNHDEEILPQPTQPTPTGDLVVPWDNESSNLSESEEDEIELGTDKAIMEVYHLDDLRQEGTGELLGFACTGIEGMKGPCGVVYKSIEDRMLKGPEECSGCFVRMGQG